MPAPTRVALSCVFVYGIIDDIFKYEENAISRQIQLWVKIEHFSIGQQIDDA